MFQFRRFPTYCYFIHSTLTRYCRAGFPHSDIHGSKDICSSPWLFAACHVLLRLLMPRHSPCALSSLTFVGAKSARLRFRRQPMAVCENCARFLAPSLNFKTRFEVVCGGTLNADLTPCYGHIAVLRIMQAHRSFQLVVVLPLKVPHSLACRAFARRPLLPCLLPLFSFQGAAYRLLRPEQNTQNRS